MMEQQKGSSPNPLYWARLFLRQTWVWRGKASNRRLTSWPVL